MMQTPGSSVPPIRAATVASGLYKSCACLREHCTPVARLPSTPPTVEKLSKPSFTTHLPVISAIPEKNRRLRLRTLFETLFDGTHPLRIALDKLQTLETMSII